MNYFKCKSILYICFPLKKNINQMNTKLTKSLAIIITALMLGSSQVQAQEFKDKFFFAHGFSIFTEAFFGRKIVYPILDPIYFNEQPSTPIPGWSYFTYTPNFRYNLTEFDDNSSLSVNVPVGLGLMVSEYGFGSINFPVYLAYNVGNISTYKSDKNKGFTIGLGFEYYNMALFKNNDFLGADANLHSSWVEPCVNIGYRYWNSKNLAKEFNLKLGFGPSNTTTVSGVTAYEETSTVVVKLTWFRYLSY